MSLQFVWTWCLQGMMGIWENLTVLDPEQVTTEFQETELHFDEARKQVACACYSVANV